MNDAICHHVAIRLTCSAIVNFNGMDRTSQDVFARHVSLPSSKLDFFCTIIITVGCFKWGDGGRVAFVDISSKAFCNCVTCGFPASQVPVVSWFSPK